MNYHNITKDDMLNGDGLRVVLWVSGCSHFCKGCQNPMTWNPNDGLKFTHLEKQEIFEQLDKSYIEGITFSGGDPLYKGNVDTVTDLAREIRGKYPEKTIWLYTGYVWEQIMSLEIMEYLDVIVDGEFVLKERDITLPWRGSGNQRVIDVKRTKEKNEIVLHSE